jgi:hypothetical protein
MKTHVLTGSKSEIAETLAKIEGEIRQVIVFVEEPTDSTSEPSTEDIFAEMEPFTVQVESTDDSRESLCMLLERE